ncbi:ribonuclease HII [Aureimonas populi]|uniref:Ribonuclease HII n=1 Tax=Aureimonas populi TaxID=1701758 RepID=A0ABW5CIT8_9HYPH|nr:ribonuclease HII [Aureimonas populi]
MTRPCSDSPLLPSLPVPGEPASPLPHPGPDYALEEARLARGARLVAGIDEAGRGPLAGPVVTAAVILKAGAIPDGLDDSKKMAPEDRERLFPEILRWATVSVASSSAGEIDRLNIRQATLLAMCRAFAGLGTAPCHALIDGRDVPLPLLAKASAIVGGDARSLSIAAASIVAKVTRDRIMARLCASFPAYGFSRHMGYATKQHLGALEQHGPCPYHRMSFRPIRPPESLLV